MDINNIYTQKSATIPVGLIPRAIVAKIIPGVVAIVRIVALIAAGPGAIVVAV